MSYIASGTVSAGCGAVALGLVQGHNGAAVLQAEISSIALAVWDITTGARVAVTTATPVVAATVFDTLQTNNGWTQDDTGYNFRHAIDSAAFPTEGRVYEVVYTFTPTSGAVFDARFIITAR